MGCERTLKGADRFKHINMKSILILFLSIGVAASNAAVCDDESKWCHNLTRYGACNFSKYTQEQCRKSCNLCDVQEADDEQISTELQDETCRDLNQWCHHHTRYGGCTISEFTKENCRKSCGLC